MNQIEKVFFIFVFTVLGMPFIYVAPQELLLHFNINIAIGMFMSLLVLMFIFFVCIVSFIILKFFFVQLPIILPEASRFDIKEYNEIELRKKLRYA